jgi:chaperonin cofactor prefoldin
MENEFVTCTRCGREVPRTMYCIYCGASLSEGGAKPEHKTVDEPASREGPKLPPTFMFLNEQISLAPELHRQEAAQPKAKGDLDPEITQMLEDLRQHQIWRIKLCEMLVNGRVSETVFTKIYEDYMDVIDRLSRMREERLSSYRSQYEERMSELQEAKREHEELRVRTEVGQIPGSQLLGQAPPLEERIERLIQETSELEVKMSQLEVFTEISPKELFDLLTTVRECLRALEDREGSARIGDELSGRIKEDLLSIMDVFERAVGSRREMEKELQDELNTLEVRYKVGEITYSEYENKRRRIHAKLESIWA